jgi:hypothetical protein
MEQEWQSGYGSRRGELEEAWLMRLLFKDIQNNIYHRIFNPTTCTALKCHFKQFNQYILYRIQLRQCRGLSMPF